LAPAYRIISRRVPLVADAVAVVYPGVIAEIGDPRCRSGPGVVWRWPGGPRMIHR
jgi:hypothetical protein